MKGGGGSAPWVVLAFAVVALLVLLAPNRHVLAAGQARRSAEPPPSASAPIEVHPFETRWSSGVRELPIDYASAIRLGATRSLDILVARARLEERRGERASRAGALLPSLSSAFRAQRIDGEIQASFGELDRRSFSTIEPEIAVALRFNPGASVFDLLAAHKRVQAAHEHEDQVAQEALAVVATLYFGLLRARVEVDIARAEIETAGELVRLARDRHELGVGLEVDVARAKARLARAEVGRAAAEERFRSASADLSEALQLEPQVLLRPREREVRLASFVDAEQDVEVLLATALDRRPGLRELALELDAARDRQRAARWAALGPEVFGTFEESAIGRSLDVNNRQIYGGLIGWTFSPSSIGELRAASARAERVRLERQRVEQRIVSELVKTRDRVLAAQGRISAARRGVRAAEQSLKLSRDRFRSGVGLALDVLEAQEALTGARTELVAALVDCNVAQVRLLFALGEATEKRLVGGLDR